MNQIVQSILGATKQPERFRDAERFSKITKFIANGRLPGSTTKDYAEALAPITNTGEYSSSDVVGICASGDNRRGRCFFDLEEMMLAIQARATIITYDLITRESSTDPGPKEIARFLRLMHYQEAGGSGTWRPSYLH